jgi:glucokinase
MKNPAQAQGLHVLAGDVGGTKTNLALFDSDLGLNHPLTEATLPSKEYSSLEELVQHFLSGGETRVDRASFGVPGPVENGQASATNLPWTMNEADLARVLGIPRVHLLNDVLAFAHAVPFFQEKDLHVLNQGQPEAEGAIAVVAPGTGLGEAYLTWDGAGYHAFASEGGHCDFAPRNDLEIGLLQYLGQRLDHVSYESVCSGRGIANIYTYLKESGYAGEPEWLREQFAQSGDPAAVIVQAAQDQGSRCDLCSGALDLFVSILGAEAGNMALKVMATGGVYLAGGIPARIMPQLEEGPFLRAFMQKGRMSGLVQNVPVRVLSNPKAALLGAACHSMSTGPQDHEL